MCPQSVGEASWSLKPSEGVRDFVCDFNPCSDRDCGREALGFQALDTVSPKLRVCPCVPFSPQTFFRGRELSV